MEDYIVGEEPVTRAEFEMLQDNIKDYRAGIKEQLREIRESLEAIWNKMDGRPSWTVLGVITFLCSLVTLLLTLVLTK